MIVVGVGGCVGYFFLSNLFLDKVLFPARGPNAGVNTSRANMIRPWLFLFPAMVALGLYLAYPVFATAWLSLNRNGEFVGLANYSAMFGEPKFWESMRNNMLWLVVVPAGSTAFGQTSEQAPTNEHSQTPTLLAMISWRSSRPPSRESWL